MKQLTQDEIEEFYVLLKEIENKIGPFKMDNHEHAVSVIENSSKNAKRIREMFTVDTSEKEASKRTEPE